MLLLLLSAQNVISLPLPSEPSLISQVECNTETLSACPYFCPTCSGIWDLSYLQHELKYCLRTQFVSCLDYGLLKKED